jgi:hypothetical protein
METRHSDYESLLFRYNEGMPFSEMIKPLGETAFHSSNLIVGYAGGGFGPRSELIPYFHLLGQEPHAHARRVFIVAYASEADNRLPFALLSVMLHLLTDQSLFENAEVTIFPKVPEIIAGEDNQALKVLRKEFRRLQPHVLFEAGSAGAPRSPLAESFLEADSSRKAHTAFVHHYYPAPPDVSGPDIAGALHEFILPLLDA